jgi:hypothetical protein
VTHNILDPLTLLRTVTVGTPPDLTYLIGITSLWPHSFSRTYEEDEIMALPPIVSATLQSSLIAAGANILAQAITAHQNNASHAPPTHILQCTG